MWNDIAEVARSLPHTRDSALISLTKYITNQSMSTHSFIHFHGDLWTTCGQRRTILNSASLAAIKINRQTNSPNFEISHPNKLMIRFRLQYPAGEFHLRPKTMKFELPRNSTSNPTTALTQSYNHCHSAFISPYIYI